MVLKMKAWEVIGKGAAAGPLKPTAATVRVWGPLEAQAASQPSCLWRGHRRVKVAQVLGCWGWRGVSEYL